MFAAGALDASFSADGLATVDFGPGITVSSRDVAVQADGKTVVVGAASNGDIALARFNVDGSLDTTFGASRTGKVLTHVGLADLPCAADAVAIMPSGNIVVAGQARFERPQYGFDIHSMVLVRYNADGTPATYNRVEQTKFGSSIMAEAKDLAVQSDGKIVVAGTVLNGNYANMFVARYQSNFARDNSFDGDGVKFVAWSGDTVGRAVTIDYTGTASTNPRFGSIVVAGTKQERTAYAGFVVARLKPNGGFDNSFDGDGRAMMYIGGAATDASGVVMQPDGKIVVAGTATYNAPLDNKFALARLTANGAADTTFAGAGTGWTTTDLFGDDRAFDVIRSFDGKLLVGGTTNGQFGVIQYNADGTIDRSFGTNGYRVTPLAGGNAAIARLASGPGRRFVATGGSAFRTARYLDAGANLVTLGTFNPKASEQGSKSTSFIVGRTERLPYPTRLYLKIGGTASVPSWRPGSGADYTLGGVTMLPPVFGSDSTPFVEIPANQTFVVVTLTPRDDSIVEGTETATFSIRANPAYELGTPAGTTINIADNDGLTINPRLGGRRMTMGRPETTAPRSLLGSPAPAPAARFSQHLISELL
jgi:uncharacterized delta-60 repeat protein